MVRQVHVVEHERDRRQLGHLVEQLLFGPGNGASVHEVSNRGVDRRTTLVAFAPRP